MANEQYVSIVIKKELLNTIGKLDLNKSLEMLVTEAIVEYIRIKTFRATNKTSSVWPLKFGFISTIGNVLNNEYKAKAV